MKKLLRKPVLLGLIIFIMYLFLLLLFVLILVAYPINKQKNRMDSYTVSICEQYLQNKYVTMERLSGPTFHIFIVDENRQIVKYTGADNLPIDDYYNYLLPEFSAALKGKKIFHIKKSPEEHSLLRLWFVDAIPADNNGTIKCAVISVENMINIQESAIAFTILFTVLYWVFIIMTIRTGKQRKHLEELKDNYIDNVTHELKAPGASIKVLIESLSDNESVDSDPEKRRLYYGMVLSSINKQNHMINEILDLSRLKSHPESLPKTVLTFDELFEPAMERAIAMCDCIDITFSYPDDTASLPKLMTNQRISQVFENLLNNAISYTPEGGNVELDVMVSKGHITVRIFDDGQSISKEDQAHIFERFYKCNSTGNNDNGTGLGLAIAHEIISSLGEKIWVESEPGKGVAFYFTVTTAN